MLHAAILPEGAAPPRPPPTTSATPTPADRHAGAAWTQGQGVCCLEPWRAGTVQKRAGEESWAGAKGPGLAHAGNSLCLPHPDSARPSLWASGFASLNCKAAVSGRPRVAALTCSHPIAASGGAQTGRRQGSGRDKGGMGAEDWRPPQCDVSGYELWGAL